MNGPPSTARTLARAPLVAAATVLALLVAMILASPRFLLFDERYYMESAYFLRTYRDLELLLATPLDLGAGPFYALYHVALAPLTGLALPAVRLANLAALIVALAATAGATARLGYDRPLARAVMLLAVPMAMPVAGLALTEVPALACAAVAVWAGASALVSAGRRAWLWWLAAGLAAGCAVLARQTYLPGLLGFALIALARRDQRAAALAGLGLALVLVGLLVWAWGGLAAPGFVPGRKLVVPEYGLRAFIYLSVAMVLIAPRFFADAFGDERAWLCIAAAGAAIAVVAGFAGYRMPVADRVIAILPASLQAPATTLGFAAMVALAMGAAASGAVRLWQHRSDRRFLFLALLTVLLTGTAAGIGHQFASRYVLTAFPFALLLLMPWIEPGRWAALRLAGGAAIGLASLAAYYWNPPPTDPAFRLAAPPEIIAQMPLEPGLVPAR